MDDINFVMNLYWIDSLFTATLGLKSSVSSSSTEQARCCCYCCHNKCLICFYLCHDDFSAISICQSRQTTNESKTVTLTCTFLYMCRDSNIVIAPCYQESVANIALPTVGGVRFIKWAQDPLVSFVKCEPPSIQLSGDKQYSTFQDVLAPISFFCHCKSQMAPQVEGYAGGPNQPLKSSLTLKGKSFLHNKQVGERLHPSCEVSAYLVLRGKMHLNPQFANLSSSSMGAIGPGVNSIEEVLEFPVKRTNNGSKIHSNSTHKELT